MRGVPSFLALALMPALWAQQSLIRLEGTGPGYSDEAVIARLAGVVALSVVVNAQGEAQGVNVLQPLGLGLDENALAAVSKWRLAPAGLEGKVETAFGGFREWRSTQVVFDAADSALRPVLISAAFPGIRPVEEKATAAIEFDVAPDGMPENVEILSVSDPSVEHAIYQAVREWRFRAGTVDGVPGTFHARLGLAYEP